MSEKCPVTASFISISAKSVPRAPASTSAFERVRLVVPKQGIVTESMDFLSIPRISTATAATSAARVESSPPESPRTRPFE